MFYVYILYSKLIDKYYVGCTSMGIEERLRRHLSSHSGFKGRPQLRISGIGINSASPTKILSVSTERIFLFGYNKKQ